MKEVMRMVDTHAHINSRDLKNVRDEIKRINNLKYLYDINLLQILHL